MIERRRTEDFSQMVITIKIKGLRPSLREKKRYMLLDIRATRWKDKLKENFLRLFGEYGLANAGILFVNKDYRQIVRVNNKYVDHIRTTLVLMPYFAQTKRVSGTLKGLLGGK
jgi:RNase P/RNase MRP subunit POP5